jgi:Flp pilus assembly protein TadG
MLSALLRRRIAAIRGPHRAQALVELALVTPLLFGIILVLFQYGILFMSYLTLIHMTRDAGRWLAVHPNTVDSDVARYVAKDLPSSVMLPMSVDGPATNCTFSGTAWTCVAGTTLTTPANGGLLLTFSPACPNTDYNATTKRCTSGGNPSRGASTPQTFKLTYDAASRIFLPTTFRLGGLNVPMPGRYQTYTYTVMVEPE